MNLVIQRRGWSTLNCLVVIAIIGMLAAILLPAVQAARTAANRAACQNNLRQMGLAVSIYHDVHSTFPGRHFLTAPLTFAEQESAADRFIWDERMDSAANIAAAASVCPSLFQCPANARAISELPSVTAGNIGWNAFLPLRRREEASQLYSSDRILLLTCIPSGLLRPWSAGERISHMYGAVSREHHSTPMVAIDGHTECASAESACQIYVFLGPDWLEASIPLFQD